jgi:quinol monooxygenase YgiN
VCQRAIPEAEEPDTLPYTSLQENENHNHFMHHFIFKDEAARDLHANSDAVNRFTSILYPFLVAPVEFTVHKLFASTG